MTVDHDTAAELNPATAFNRDLVQRLRRLPDDGQLSWNKLARKTGIPKGTLRSWVTNKTLVSADHVETALRGVGADNQDVASWLARHQVLTREQPQLGSAATPSQSTRPELASLAGTNRDRAVLRRSRFRYHLWLPPPCGRQRATIGGLLDAAKPVTERPGLHPATRRGPPQAGRDNPGIPDRPDSHLTQSRAGNLDLVLPLSVVGRGERT
jgi:hypothetical protein